MHQFHIPRCTIQNRNMHIYVLNGALWDMERVHCGIFKKNQGQLFNVRNASNITDSEEPVILKMPSCGVQVMHAIIDLSDQTTRYAGSWGQVMQSFRQAPMKEMLSYLTDLLVTSTNPIKGSTAPSPHGGTDWLDHYTDVIMITMASQITSLAVVYSKVYSCANQRKHQSSASLAFVREFTGGRWNG